MQIQSNMSAPLQPSNVSVPTQMPKMEQNVAQDVQEDVQKSNKDELKKELQSIVAALNKEMAPMNSDIKFGFQEEAETFYVSVIDVKNDKVIRKYPSDEAMRLMSKMREVIGSIFDQKG